MTPSGTGFGLGASDGALESEGPRRVAFKRLNESQRKKASPTGRKACLCQGLRRLGHP
jgi:hypothetical protein